MPQGSLALLEAVRRALNGTELRWPSPSLAADSDRRTWAGLTAEHEQKVTEAWRLYRKSCGYALLVVTGQRVK